MLESIKIEDIDISNPHSVCNELTRITAELYYMATELSLAAKEQAREKARLESLEAALFLAFSEEAKTVEKTKAKVRTSREWIDASERYSQAMANFIELKEKLRALEIRAQALMEIARVLRAEMQVTQ